MLPLEELNWEAWIEGEAEDERSRLGVAMLAVPNEWRPLNRSSA